ncbi:uncharacterized protein METZ01_LOCUS89961, partial [marine metagenome]
KLTVVTHLRFRDHHVYSQKDCNKINSALKEKGGDYILTTEKDIFKLCAVFEKNNILNLSSKTYSLPIRFVFQDKTLDEIWTQLR